MDAQQEAERRLAAYCRCLVDDCDEHQGTLLRIVAAAFAFTDTVDTYWTADLEYDGDGMESAAGGTELVAAVRAAREDQTDD